MPEETWLIAKWFSEISDRHFFKWLRFSANTFIREKEQQQQQT